MGRKVSTKNILQNGGLFVLLILLTFYIIFKNNNIEDIISTIYSLNIKYIILAIICSFTFTICEGINIGRCLKIMNYNVKFKTSIKYAIVGLFFSSITPSSSGGQPMQVYYMHKDGIEISHSSLAILINLASFQFVTVTMAIIGYISQHKLLINNLGNIKYLIAFGVILNFLVMLAILIAIFSKRFVGKLIDFISFVLIKIKYKKVDRFIDFALCQIKEYRNSAKYLKENKITIFKIILTTVIQIVLFFSIPFCIYKAFDLSGHSLFTVVMLQSILFISVSALPLPGAVGVSESAFIMIYKTLFPYSFLSSAMLVSRGISFYLLVFLGGIIIATIDLLNIKSNNYVKISRKEKNKNQYT